MAASRTRRDSSRGNTAAPDLLWATGPGGAAHQPGDDAHSGDLPCRGGESRGSSVSARQPLTVNSFDRRIVGTNWSRAWRRERLYAAAGALVMAGVLATGARAASMDVTVRAPASLAVVAERVRTMEWSPF